MMNNNNNANNNNNDRLLSLSVSIDLEVQDSIYLIENSEVQKDKKYRVHCLEIKEDGNWHDGYVYSHYAYLEEVQTQLISLKLIAVTSRMLQIKELFFEKCD